MATNDDETHDPFRQIPYDPSALPVAPKLPDQIHIHVHVAAGYPAPPAQPAIHDIEALVRTASAPASVRRSRPVLRWGGTALAVAAAFLVGQYAASPALPTIAAVATPAPAALAQVAPPSPAATFHRPGTVGREAVNLPELPAGPVGQPATAAIGGNLAGPPPFALLQQLAQPPRIEPPRVAAAAPAPGPAPAGPPRNAFGLER